MNPIALLALSFCVQVNPSLIRGAAQNHLVIRGVVQDGAGKARVGAQVLCVARGVPHFLPAEVLRAQTNKRGRFHLSLNPGREYWVWSHFIDSSGGHFASRIAKRVVPGEILVLKDELLLLPRRVHFHGLDFGESLKICGSCGIWMGGKG